MSKNDPKTTVFHKYDVEAAIDEIENAETQSTFKYGFTILSNPKNVRLTIEGVTKVIGDAKEREDILAKDENEVPKILSIIYQELFSTFFLLSKSLNVSCPPHFIGTMGDMQSQMEETKGEETEKEIVDVVSSLNSESNSVLETDENSSEKEELETPNALQQ